MQEISEQQVFSAVADPTRRRILRMLLTEQMAVHDVAAEFSVSRPAVSRHLAVLKSANLVVEEKQGRERLYRTNPAPLHEVSKWLNVFWDAPLKKLKKLVEGD